jgi:hypothetical protein
MDKHDTNSRCLCSVHAASTSATTGGHRNNRLRSLLRGNNRRRRIRILEAMMDNNDLNYGCSMKKFIQRVRDSLESVSSAPIGNELEDHLGPYVPHYDQQVPGFVSQFELAHLAKYRMLDAITYERLLFESLQSESGNFAGHAEQILQVLGAEERFWIVREAFREAALKCAPDYWRVFRYGTPEERQAYYENGGLDISEPGAAESVASNVVDSVFCEGTAQEQLDLLHEELSRYSVQLHGYAGPSHVLRIWLPGSSDVTFPVQLKPLVLSTGVDDDDPRPGLDHNTSFKLSLEQAKALLATLDEIAKKGHGALRMLVFPERGRPQV